MKTVFAKELEYPKDSLCIWGVLKHNLYPEEIINFLIAHGKQREKHKIKIKKIMSTDSKPFRKEHEKSAEIKYLPYASSVGLSVIGDLSVISIISQNPIFICIKDESVAKSFKEQFELLWKIAKK